MAALLRVVRPEFRVERFVPPAGHFLAPTPCVITTCLRKNASRGLCAAHDAAWRKAGRPEREAWIADPANWPAGLSLDVAPYLVGGCRYSGGLSCLCDLHLADLNGLHSRGQRISVRQYAAAAPVLFCPSTSRCAFPDCGYGISRRDLCDGHHYRWSKVGQPPLAGLPAELELRNIPSFSVAGLPPLVALEFQYLLQLRTDQRRSKVIPSSWIRAINTVITEGVSSVRDRPVDHWRHLSLNHTTVPQLFADLLEALGDLDGPAEEWDRDVWRPDRLGYTIEERQRVAPLDFTGITQPWLRQTIKRYLRLRLARTELRTAARDLNDFLLFSRFIAEARPDQQNDPAVLESSSAGPAAGRSNRKGRTSASRWLRAAAAACCRRSRPCSTSCKPTPLPLAVPARPTSTHGWPSQSSISSRALPTRRTTESPRRRGDLPGGPVETKGEADAG
ncbi:hypothetical protein VM98_30775 [Streptomyces rubellomurinus subsp. indigoferus]|nr:hypothetical protein VM98_30775 [Streptomyces rubellomurinus subsp. indigoferus]